MFRCLVLLLRVLSFFFFGSETEDICFCASKHFCHDIFLFLTFILSFLLLCNPYSGANVWISLRVLWLCTKNRCCWSSTHESIHTMVPGCYCWYFCSSNSSFRWRKKKKKLKTKRKEWKKWENLFRAPCSHFLRRMMLGKMRFELRPFQWQYTHKCTMHMYAFTPKCAVIVAIV